jgi:hypothetical protein
MSVWAAMAFDTPRFDMTVALALPGCACEIRSALHTADRVPRAR